MQTKIFNSDFRKMDDYTFKSTISTITPDRDNEIVQPSGMLSNNFEKNPIVLFQHDDNRPIGRCLQLSRFDDRIEAVTKLTKRPDYIQGEWLPDIIKAFLEDKVLNSISISFKEIISRVPKPVDIEKFGEVKRIHSKWELLEYSVVSLPANPEAVIKCARDRNLETGIIKKYFNLDVPKKPTRILMDKHWINEIIQDELKKLKGDYWI